MIERGLRPGEHTSLLLPPVHRYCWSNLGSHCLLEVEEELQVELGEVAPLGVEEVEQPLGVAKEGVQPGPWVSTSDSLSLLCYWVSVSSFSLILARFAPRSSFS